MDEAIRDLERELLRAPGDTRLRSRLAEAHHRAARFVDGLRALGDAPPSEARELARTLWAKALASELRELARFEEWKRASTARQDAVVAAVLDLHADRFAVVGSEPWHGTRIVTVCDGQTGIDLSVVPGGTFAMGLSPEEEADVRARADSYEVGAFLERAVAMRPVREVAVGPFLLARHPLTATQARALDVAGDPTLRGEIVLMKADEARAVATRAGCALPSEAQWEYACRGGTSTPFWWGRDVPRDAGRWCDRFDDGGRATATNGFGLVAMGAFPELCADDPHPTYEGAPVDDRPWLDPARPPGVPTPGDVARGGAALGYPWQAAGEWLWLLSAARSPGTVPVGLPRYAVRLAFSLVPTAASPWA